jgi:hypothetical protein
MHNTGADCTLIILLEFPSNLKAELSSPFASNVPAASVCKPPGELKKYEHVDYPKV